jgi:N-acetylglutamate synthase-like GNAT family acetyltransferase
MDIQQYSPADRRGCLEVFDSNTPSFFASAERAEFESFLDQPDCAYFVMKHNGEIVGCGGYAILVEQKLAVLTWGMVRRDLQKQGLGRFLLMFRLREISKHGDVQSVRLHTSQNTAPFFEKQGFKVLSVVQDGYAAGLHRVEMVKKMAVCT